MSRRESGDIVKLLLVKLVGLLIVNTGVATLLSIHASSHLSNRRLSNRFFAYTLRALRLATVRVDTALVLQKNQHRNIFGLLSRTNAFEGYEISANMRADVLVAFLDGFATKITPKTVVVLDHAPFHFGGVVAVKTKE